MEQDLRLLGGLEAVGREIRGRVSGGCEVVDLLLGGWHCWRYRSMVRWELQVVIDVAVEIEVVVRMDHAQRIVVLFRMADCPS